MAKYHIDKNGMPAICRATKRPCPLGGDDVHFDSFEEANVYAQKQLEKKYGILGESDDSKELVGFEKQKAREKAIAEMIEDLESRNNYSPKNYIARCYESERIPRLWVRGKTYHASDERREKEERLIEMFGEGNYVGDYKVFHKVGSMHEPKYQYTRVYDNGRIVMYDYESKEKITTFMAHETRVAGVLLRAGEIPDEEMLDRIKENYIKERNVQRKQTRQRGRKFKGRKKRNNRRRY